MPPTPTCHTQFHCISIINILSPLKTKRIPHSPYFLFSLSTCSISFSLALSEKTTRAIMSWCQSQLLICGRDGHFLPRPSISVTPVYLSPASRLAAEHWALPGPRLHLSRRDSCRSPYCSPSPVSVVLAEAEVCPEAGLHIVFDCLMSSNPRHTIHKESFLHRIIDESKNSIDQKYRALSNRF